MVCIGEDDLDTMRTGRKADEDHGLTTRIRPVPGRPIDRDVDVADTRTDFERFGTEYRLDSKIFGAVLNEYLPLSERARKRRIDDDPRWRLWCGKRDDARRTQNVTGGLCLPCARRQHQRGGENGIYWPSHRKLPGFGQLTSAVPHVFGSTRPWSRVAAAQEAAPMTPALARMA